MLWFKSTKSVSNNWLLYVLWVFAFIIHNLYLNRSHNIYLIGNVDVQLKVCQTKKKLDVGSKIWRNKHLTWKSNYKRALISLGLALLRTHGVPHAWAKKDAMWTEFEKIFSPLHDDHWCSSSLTFTFHFLSLSRAVERNGSKHGGTWVLVKTLLLSVSDNFRVKFWEIDAWHEARILWLQFSRKLES